LAALVGAAEPFDTFSGLQTAPRKLLTPPGKAYGPTQSAGAGYALAVMNLGLLTWPVPVRWQSLLRKSPFSGGRGGGWIRL